MQKIKNLLHHNQDANHNGIPDSQERTTTTANRTLAKDPIVHDHGTTLPNTVIPPTNAATTTVTSTSTLGGNALGNDRNMNGIPDNLEGGRHFNPLDRNHDGKVSLADLKPGAKREAALRDANAAGLSNDRNMNGIPDNLERTTGLGATGLSNDRNMNGIPDNLERRHNPLDRNGDGRVDLKDLTGRPGYGQQGLAGGLSNDRNMNGIPDNLERTSGFGTTGLSNDRNMNGIPDNLEYGSASSYGSSVSAVRAEPTVVQVVEKGVVVHEHIHPVEKEEIQPIIYREREQLEVKQITQQLHETAIQPTLVQQRELAAEVRAPIVERGAPIQENVVLPSVDRDATMRSVQVNQPIVNETIKKTVIEEVQPVLERDVFVPTVVQETQPIYEKIVEAPHVYRETLPVRELGTRNADFVQPIVREAPIVAPVVAPVAQPHLVQPVTVTTTTTTTDTFIPAKLVATELKSTHAAPTGRKLI